jgi:hypothetical protein
LKTSILATSKISDRSFKSHQADRDIPWLSVISAIDETWT